jgi:hypothetical protein
MASGMGVPGGVDPSRMGQDPNLRNIETTNVQNLTAALTPLKNLQQGAFEASNGVKNADVSTFQSGVTDMFGKNGPLLSSLHIDVGGKQISADSHEMTHYFSQLALQMPNHTGDSVFATSGNQHVSNFQMAIMSSLQSSASGHTDLQFLSSHVDGPATPASDPTHTTDLVFSQLLGVLKEPQVANAINHKPVSLPSSGSKESGNMHSVLNDCAYVMSMVGGNISTSLSHATSNLAQTYVAMTSNDNLKN